MRYHVLTEKLLRDSCRKARELGHSWVGPVHFLLALSREPGPAGQVLRLLGMDPDLTENMARLLYGFSEGELPLPQGLTPEAEQLLRQAAGEARQQKQRQLQPHHLLLALSRQEESETAQLLAVSGISGKVVVAGSSSVTPVMEKLKEAYVAINPDVTIEVQMSDSSTGVNYAIDGTCDLGMASRALKASEMEKGAVSTAIALDGIAVIVNNDAAVSGLTAEQVCGIYTGEITDWNQIQ